ncbi:hypothetical protein I4F81_011613 [Pyropia yezoensis]|uniref:Uncharacterized protein n=1 Tax=Pyropia yezoensis TaxID=2788 RepID=A0ACC3CFU9_PYRYE|nr:hypothetical protein I4F81_011613 [Neopyropia yezoensis]
MMGRGVGGRGVALPAAAMRPVAAHTCATATRRGRPAARTAVQGAAQPTGRPAAPGRAPAPPRRAPPARGQGGVGERLRRRVGQRLEEQLGRGRARAAPRWGGTTPPPGRQTRHLPARRRGRGHPHPANTTTTAKTSTTTTAATPTSPGPTTAATATAATANATHDATAHPRDARHARHGRVPPHRTLSPIRW